MKPFQLFKTGTHTAANGATLTFSERQLKAAVAAYDPALHEAPIVVGHPKDNAPAFGWIKSLNFSDGVVTANPDQLNEDFAELVKAGSYKKRSASWYLPDAPNNPKPGTLYLRHVAFLGAQPPAIKGLKDVSFSDAEEGVIEFGEWEDRSAFGSLASLLRSLRDWLIADRGLEEADKVLPNWEIDSVKRAYDSPPDLKPQTTEPVTNYQEGHAMTIEELKAQVAALTAENVRLTANQKPADFAEKETNLAAREAALVQREAVAARATVEARVDGLIKAGKVLPAQRAHHINFAMALSDVGESVDFAEGDKTLKLSQREAYFKGLDAAPKIVEYKEISGASGEASGGGSDPAQIAIKARAAVDKAASEGRTLSFSEAVAAEMATAEQK